LAVCEVPVAGLPNKPSTSCNCRAWSLRCTISTGDAFASFACTVGEDSRDVAAGVAAPENICIQFEMPELVLIECAECISNLLSDAPAGL
jgi:hypothetical protein